MFIRVRAPLLLSLHRRAPTSRKGTRMSINTTIFKMSDDKKENLGQRINVEDRPSALGRRNFCSHCKFESSRLFKITRESFMYMREDGLIPDGPEDFLPGGPFLFCHNGCAVEFFWRRYQLGRLRGDLKTKPRGFVGEAVYATADGRITPAQTGGPPIGKVVGETPDGQMYVQLDHGGTITI